MTIEKADHAREKGVALVYVGIFLVPLLLCTGLAVDLGWGYLVRATLAKAVDAAALAAANNITGDDPSQAERVADNIFDVNFPPGFLGVTPSRPILNTTIGPNGSHVIDVKSDATLPTTFMRLASFDSLTVRANAQATRRLVDMSFVIDRSGSLTGAFSQVVAAASDFVGSFDPMSDRIALITFSSGTTVMDQIRSTRGFDMDQIKTHINSTTPDGATATAEALYQAWDQLRTVPPESRNGLRIVVLFTDGSPNSFPSQFQVMSPVANGCNSTPWPGLRKGTFTTWDYPYVGNSSTKEAPWDLGLYPTNSPSVIDSVYPTNWIYYVSPRSTDKLLPNPCIPKLPPLSYHELHKSANIPLAFKLYDPALHSQRLIDKNADGSIPSHVQNANNAARNLAEIIANAIRNDTDGSDKRTIRIYTLGLGDLLYASMGSKPETGASILERIANDPASPDPDDHNTAQLDGKFFYAGDPSELKAAFQTLRDQVIRLTQ